MQVSQLVARASIFHVCALNYLVGLFINDICLVLVHTFDVVLSLLTTDDEDLILSLDR